MSTTKTAISTSGLVKSFGATRALDGLNLEVSSGEVHGFLGPNGSGKTTTLRILLGLVRADSGRSRLLDGDPWEDGVRLHRRLAYVPGGVALWPDLTGGEVIDLMGRLRGGLDAERRSSLLKRFELDPTRKCGHYSTGNRQKVALVAAFASNLELLLLDEPTLGLDPLMEEVFRQFVLEERQRGRTILLSSHILAEVEALCDRITIIRNGRAIESGTLTELRHLTRTSITADLIKPPSGLEQIAGVSGLSVKGNHVSCEVDNLNLNAVILQLTQSGLVSLISQPPTLEDLFLHYYAREKKADEKQEAIQ